MNHDPPTDLLLTARDVAECLSISVRTVWRWAAAGKLPPPLKLSKQIKRWKASQIQELIDAISSADRGQAP